MNVRVTSNSYGLDDSPSQAVRDALEALGGAGVLSVFAAGNSAKDVDVSCDYPACFRLPSTINVAATDSADRLAGFSSYGSTNVDLAAPGVNITVAEGASTNGYHSFFSGTSAACPYVAGSVALLAAAYPSATGAEIKTALMETVDLLPTLTNKMVSHGRLNVGRAIYHPGLSTDAPPHVLMSPLSQTNGLGYAATFCVSATGAQPIDYVWHFEGSEIAHTTEPLFTLPDLAMDDAGAYHVVLSNAFGMATSTVATLTVVTQPTIWAHPQSVRVLDGSNVVFEVGAAGAFPLCYQWQRDGADIPGETNANIAFINTRSSMNGEYRAILSNSHGSATTSVAQLTVFTRPHIIVQPQSQTVAVGSDVSLSVTVTNTATLPIGVRWRRAPMTGPATTLNGFMTVTNLLNIQTAQAGLWSAILTNAAPNGVSLSVSSNAYVTVVVPPTNQTVLAGEDVTFSATAVGPGTLAYQWQRHGTNIPNATGRSLTLTAVQPPDAGNYSIVVTNGIGQPTSFSAVLQVVGPPLLTEPVRLPDGRFQTILTGLVPDQPYTVEVSTNLTHWDARPPFNATAESMPFIDDTASDVTQRFYRARAGAP